MTLLTLFVGSGAGGIGIYGVGPALPVPGVTPYGSCLDFTLELRKRRRDTSAIKHPISRYKEIVNQAIGMAPRSLWRHYIHNGTLTVEEQLRYPVGANTVTSFAAGDTTPSVSTAAPAYITANVGATTITMFDNGYVGQAFVLFVNDAFTTIDFTGTNLVREEGSDWAAAEGAWMEAVFDGTDWNCITHDSTAYPAPGLYRADWVYRVTVEDEDGNDQILSNWAIEEDEDVLTLVLGKAPAEDGRTIRLFYVTPWPSLNCADTSDTTGLSHDWVIAMGMILLLTEADPARENPQLLAQDLALYTNMRQGIEGREGKRRVAGRAKFHDWSN